MDATVRRGERAEEASRAEVLGGGGGGGGGGGDARLLSKYRKMLTMGIPRFGVEQRMRRDGLAPSLLDGGEGGEDGGGGGGAAHPPALAPLPPPHYVYDPSPSEQPTMLAVMRDGLELTQYGECYDARRARLLFTPPARTNVTSSRNLLRVRARRVADPLPRP